MQPMPFGENGDSKGKEERGGRTERSVGASGTAPLSARGAKPLSSFVPAIVTRMGEDNRLRGIAVDRARCPSEKNRHAPAAQLLKNTCL